MLVYIIGYAVPIISIAFFLHILRCYHGVPHPCCCYELLSTCLDALFLLSSLRSLCTFLAVVMMLYPLRWCDGFIGLYLIKHIAAKSSFPNAANRRYFMFLTM